MRAAWPQDGMISCPASLLWPYGLEQRLPGCPNQGRNPRWNQCDPSEVAQCLGGCHWWGGTCTAQDFPAQSRPGRIAKLHFWMTWFPCWSSMHFRTSKSKEFVLHAESAANSRKQVQNFTSIFGNVLESPGKLPCFHPHFPKKSSQSHHFFRVTWPFNSPISKTCFSMGTESSASWRGDWDWSPFMSKKQFAPNLELQEK